LFFKDPMEPCSKLHHGGTVHCPVSCLTIIIWGKIFYQ
jgi:hypothetical protein